MIFSRRCVQIACLVISGIGWSSASAGVEACQIDSCVLGATPISQSLLQRTYGDRRSTVAVSSPPGGGVAGAVEDAVGDAIAAVTGGGEAAAPESKEESHAQWTYAATDAWASVSVDCVGSEQSPVDIDTARVALRDGLQSSLAPLLRYVDVLAGLQLENNGHALQVNGDFGVLNLPDGPYEVKQFHFHCPSEHALDGVLYPCEVHIVHQHTNATGTDRLAVIGVLLQDSDLISTELREAFATSVERQLNFLESLGFTNDLPPSGQALALPDDFRLNLAQVFAMQLAGPFFHYQGSLTTPPCSESVHWYVLQRPAAITREMVARFKALFPAPANNRPVQMLNGRVVVQGSLETTSAEFEAVSQRQNP